MCCVFKSYDEIFVVFLIFVDDFLVGHVLSFAVILRPEKKKHVCIRLPYLPLFFVLTLAHFIGMYV